MTRGILDERKPYDWLEHELQHLGRHRRDDTRKYLVKAASPRIGGISNPDLPKEALNKTTQAKRKARITLPKVGAFPDSE